MTETSTPPGLGSHLSSTIRSWGWIQSPTADTASAFAWLPVFLLANAVNTERLRTVAAIVFLVSLVHQAITPLLLATDAPTRAKHRLIYAAGIPVIALGSWGLVHVGMAWVALVAASWNLVHTLRQRYGIVRLYGRNVGQNRRPIEQGLIFGPFLMAAAIAVMLPGTIGRVGTLGLGGINRDIVHGITGIKSVAPVLLGASTTFTLWTIGSLWADRTLRPQSSAKQLYLASYYLSLLCAIVRPAAGLLALVAAHSFEYFFALDATLGTRFGTPGTTLHRCITAVRNRRVLLAVAAAACATGLLTARHLLSVDLYLLLYMTVGGSHFLFDGFLWKAPRPTRTERLLRDT